MERNLFPGPHQDYRNEGMPGLLEWWTQGQCRGCYGYKDEGCDGEIYKKLQFKNICDGQRD